MTAGRTASSPIRPGTDMAQRARAMVGDCWSKRVNSGATQSRRRYSRKNTTVTAQITTRSQCLISRGSSSIDSRITASRPMRRPVYGRARFAGQGSDSQVVRDLRIAVDIGGTFTDVVLEEGGRRLTRKLLTTPQRPEEAVLEGVRLILADAGRGFGDVGVFVHGTTLATNAVIERRGARTALLATEGFRDILDIANESRYDQYDLTIEKPKPLVPRALRFTVPERMDVHGKIRLALDESAVRALAMELEAQGIESLAVAFMHSYVNPAHERRTREILKAALPDLWLTLSSEVCPEVREYERTSTAVANAYVQPLMDSYLERMQTALVAEKFAGTIYLVTSGGGLTAIDTARRYPVRLVESGPAGGAIFAAQVAARAGEARALSYDMGGTTAKICLIDDYQPHTARLFEVDRSRRFRRRHHRARSLRGQRRAGTRRGRRPRPFDRDGGLCRLRNGVGEHGECCPRACGRTRRRGQPVQSHRLRRRRAIACRARGREDRRQARDRAAQCRRRLGSGLPRRSRLIRAGAQPLHAPRRFRRGGRHRAPEGDERGGHRSGRAGRARHGDL